MRPPAAPRFRQLGRRVRRRTPESSRRFDHARAADVLRLAESDQRISRERLLEKGLHRRQIAAPSDHRGAAWKGERRGLVFCERRGARASERNPLRMPASARNRRVAAFAAARCRSLYPRARPARGNVGIEPRGESARDHGDGRRDDRGDGEDRRVPRRQTRVVETRPAYRGDREDLAGALRDRARPRAGLQGRHGHRRRDPRLHRRRRRKRAVTDQPLLFSRAISTTARRAVV